MNTYGKNNFEKLLNSPIRCITFLAQKTNVTKFMFLYLYTEVFINYFKILDDDSSADKTCRQLGK